MRALGANMQNEDYDRIFRFHLNLLRIESLRFWFSDNHDSTRMRVRLQETCFYNAGVLCRVHEQLATAEDFDKCTT